MPLRSEWRRFDKETTHREADRYGVYELGDSDGEILYIGWGQILTKLFTHMRDGQDPYPGVSLYRAEYAESILEAGQRHTRELEEFQRVNGYTPRFNRRRRQSIRAIR